ncbi:MAG: tetratricopeptide repeat protein, partial [Acidobacteriota bacterium]|nr:tetratricopeptide repeat protein [Acidobacteriota bacterium]
HPFYTRDKETCNSCHMEKVPTENYDVSVKDGRIASHRFAAANTAIPLAFGYKRQFEEVVKFLKDDRIVIDIFALKRRARDSSKTRLIAPIDRDNFRLKDGDILTAEVVITNKNIGHSFPPELRDFYEAFVEFSVVDEDGKILYKSGYTDANGFLDKGAHNYMTYLVFEDGKLNDLHHIWKTKVVAQNNSIQSGRSDVSRYRFVVPDGYEGTLRLTAKLNYRRFTKVFSDYVIGKSTNLPIVTMAETSETLGIGSRNRPSEPLAKAMPDWWRWNNYGIALLDNKQFPAAADAFDEVIDFKNEYRPTAYTNKAIAMMQMGGWNEADKLVSKSLKLDENNYRSLFQKGRIKKTFSKLDEAEELYKQVLEKYPNDRDTLQQLGELAKLRSEAVPEDQRRVQLELARVYFQRILAIDPEDLSAVYNLMLINRKLGDRSAAAEFALQFRDLKADTQVEFLAADFLQENLEIGNESRPFHVHDLEPFRPEWELAGYPSIAGIDWSQKLVTTADFFEGN